MNEGTGKGKLDFFLVANMYSLLNMNAFDNGILDACHKAGVKVIIGGPFSSGILALGADPPSGQKVHYIYKPASEDILNKTR
jgi:D-threo-aldose 1-dehydrogenase